MGLFVFFLYYLSLVLFIDLFGFLWVWLGAFLLVYFVYGRLIWSHWRPVFCFVLIKKMKWSESNLGHYISLHKFAKKLFSAVDINVGLCFTLSLLYLLEKQRSGILISSDCVFVPFETLKKSTDFHGTWYQRYAIEGQAMSVICLLQHSFYRPPGQGGFIA